MFARILHRPALAIVVSIIILFLGFLGIRTLPVEQFPSITPPTVEVAIAYPGASANVLVDSVLIPLEQSINGVQGMRYIVSDATSAGEPPVLRKGIRDPGRVSPGSAHPQILVMVGTIDILFKIELVDLFKILAVG